MIVMYSASFWQLNWTKELDAYYNLVVWSKDSCSEVDNDIREKERVNNDVDGEPLWIQLLLTVEGDAHWQYSHCEYQQHCHHNIPVPPEKENQCS